MWVPGHCAISRGAYLKKTRLKLIPIRFFHSNILTNILNSKLSAFTNKQELVKTVSKNLFSLLSSTTKKYAKTIIQIQKQLLSESGTLAVGCNLIFNFLYIG